MSDSIKLWSIVVDRETRHRKDLGDLAPLADSMKRIGQLQPIGITPDRVLVFGERRLEAAKLLDWKEIACRVVDPEQLLDAEHDENELRKDFTTSERVAIKRAIERQIGKRQGQRTDLPANAGKSGETAEIAAQKAGFSSERSARRAEAVVDQGAPELVAAVDADDISVSEGASIAEIPDRQRQAEIVALPKRERKAEVAKEAERRAPQVDPKERRFGAVMIALSSLLDGVAGIDFTPDEAIGAARRFNLVRRYADRLPSAAIFFADLRRKFEEANDERRQETE